MHLDVCCFCYHVSWWIKIIIRPNFDCLQQGHLSYFSYFNCVLYCILLYVWFLATTLWWNKDYHYLSNARYELHSRAAVFAGTLVQTVPITAAVYTRTHTRTHEILNSRDQRQRTCSLSATKGLFELKSTESCTTPPPPTPPPSNMSFSFRFFARLLKSIAAESCTCTK